MIDIKEILRAWANTRVMKRMGTEFPSQAVCMNGAPRSFDYRQYLTEDEAIEVDRAVLLLKRDCEKEHAVLTKFYLKNYSCSKQARILRKQTTEITRLLYGAERFVFGQIINFFDNAKS